MMYQSATAAEWLKSTSSQMKDGERRQNYTQIRIST